MSKMSRRSHVPGVVFVPLDNARVEATTDKACLLVHDEDECGETWVPLSVMHVHHKEHETIDGIWVFKWWAEKNGFPYEE